MLDWLAAQSPIGAEKVQRRLQQMLGGLVDHPRIGPATDLGRVRRLVITPFPYIVYYELAEREIVILGVRHTARQPFSLPDLNRDE